MSSEPKDSDLTAQVEAAVESAQKLDSFKQQVMAELAAEGHDVEGSRIIVAHNLTGQIQVDDLGKA